MLYNYARPVNPRTGSEVAELSTADPGPALVRNIAHIGPIYAVP